jgi:hypothetical protein
MRRFDPRSTVLAGVGVLALLLGGALAVVTVRDTGPDAAATAAPGGPGDAPDATAAGAPDAGAPASTFVSRAGGFRVRAPSDLRATRTGSAARFTSADKSVVISVGPAGRGALQAATREFLATVRASYRDVAVLGTQRDRIDGRPSLSTSGRARNDAGTELRFVVTMVRARPRNYAIAAFAGADTDPAAVLPAVNQVAGSFRVLP